MGPESAQPAQFQPLFEGGRVARAFDQLRNTRERVESILQVVVGTDGVMVQDFSGRVVYVNQPAAVLFGFDNAMDLLRLPGAALQRVRLFDETGSTPMDELPGTAILRGDAACESTLQVVAADGRKRWVTVRCSPMHDDRGAIGSSISIFRDVTDQKRTSEFHERLLGIVSHDLRGPLSTISMAAAVMSRQPEKLEPRAAKMLLQIQASCSRAVRMVHDLLDLTQGTLGRGIPVSPKLVDIEALVRAAVDEVVGAHSDRTIAVECPEPPGSALWDGDRISQVLGNLLGNAITYGRADTPVTVRVTPGADFVSLAVHNFGSPIPADQLTAMFEPFARAGTSADSGRSVGLGLYIVRELVHAHGGEVQATSDASRGTEFSVRLPRNCAPPLLSRHALPAA